MAAAAQRLRVVSLLPSATEIVIMCGGEPMLVGRSHECDFPKSITDRPVLTAAITPFENSRQMNDAVDALLAKGDGLYTVDSDLMRCLRPDVIVTQSLCHVCSVDLKLVQRLVGGMSPPPRVVSLNPQSIDDVMEDCGLVGRALGMEGGAAAAVAALRARLGAAVSFVAGRPPLPPGRRSVGFMEWVDPIFMGGHWTPQLIAMAGGEHPANPPRAPGAGAPPSFAMTSEAWAALDPDWVLVCPCGLDIQASLREMRTVVQQDWWLGLRAVKEGRVALVDGNQMFNRPGPRLVDALEFLVGLLHDQHQRIPQGFPWRMWRPDLMEDGAAVATAAGPLGSGDSAAAANGSCGGPSTKRGFSTTAAAVGVDGLAAGGGRSYSGTESSLKRSLWSCMGLPPDIEELHAAACARGDSMYTDPQTSYMVFTEHGLLKRGSCCGNRCRHCPWGHYRVTRMPRLNRVCRSLLLPLPVPGERGPTAGVVPLGAAPRRLVPWPPNSVGGESGAAARVEDAVRTAQTADQQVLLAYSYTLQDTGEGWTEAQAALHAAMDASLRLQVPLVVVVLPEAEPVTSIRSCVAGRVPGASAPQRVLQEARRLMPGLSISAVSPS